MATVQIRNVDDKTYETLKKRASLRGQSLQEYLRLMLERVAGQPSVSDVLARLRADMEWPEDRPRITMEEIVEIQRAGRDR